MAQTAEITGVCNLKWIIHEGEVWYSTQSIKNFPETVSPLFNETMELIPLTWVCRFKINQGNTVKECEYVNKKGLLLLLLSNESKPRDSFHRFKIWVCDELVSREW